MAAARHDPECCNCEVKRADRFARRETCQRAGLVKGAGGMAALPFLLPSAITIALTKTNERQPMVPGWEEFCLDPKFVSPARSAPGLSCLVSESAWNVH